MNAFIRQTYYRLRPLIPRRVQWFLRRKLARKQRRAHVDRWPVDPSCGNPPPGWRGWPEAKDFALVLTHDVEHAAGQSRCQSLMECELELGFRASFNFVPRRYADQPALRQLLSERGFEVGVHGLYHDGRLFESHETFMQRAAEINEFIAAWGAAGFRAPSMHHRLDWMSVLNVEYDASTFDVDPFEPQPDGAGTIFPFMVGTGERAFVELPYTLAQDSTVFLLLQEEGPAVWLTKLAWVAEQGGMALLNTHPDYMAFEPNQQSRETYPAEWYREFLEAVKDQYAGRFWNPVARDLAHYVKQQGLQAGRDGV